MMIGMKPKNQRIAPRVNDEVQCTIASRGSYGPISLHIDVDIMRSMSEQSTRVVMATYTPGAEGSGIVTGQYIGVFGGGDVTEGYLSLVGHGLAWGSGGPVDGSQLRIEPIDGGGSDF
eukprot:367621_1